MDSVIQYKCPNCGGELKFAPEKQGFACEWCGSDFTADEIIASEREQPASVTHSESEAEPHDYSDETDVYVCGSCGAEIICGHDTAATFCYYCHNPVSLSGRLSGDFRPEMIIPFKINRESALEHFKANCKGRWFLPTDFLSSSQLEKMVGLYVPYWLTDCKVNSELSGEGRIVNTHRHGDVIYTNTKYYAVERRAEINYIKVPADGSKKIDDNLIEAIEPFSYNELTDFSMAYLSGFYADKYDAGKEDVLPYIKQRLADASEQILKDDINGYTYIDVRRKNTDLLNIKWHYALLPVWFMTYNSKGKMYLYAMNGQTGKVSGKYPISIPKTLLVSVIAGIFAFLIAFLFKVATFI